MVKVADFPDVRVYANSQPVGKTDASGVAVIPRLSGFLPNTITFEAEDIPLEGSFGDNAKQVKIANRMGALVDMGVLRRLSATLTLTEASGRPVPAGRFRAHRRGRGGVSGGPAGTRVRERPRARQAQCPAGPDRRACLPRHGRAAGRFHLGVYAGVLYVPMTRFVLAACCALLPLSRHGAAKPPASTMCPLRPAECRGQCPQAFDFGRGQMSTHPRRRSTGNAHHHRHVHQSARWDGHQHVERGLRAEGDCPPTPARQMRDREPPFLSVRHVCRCRANGATGATGTPRARSGSRALSFSMTELGSVRSPIRDLRAAAHGGSAGAHHLPGTG